MIKKAFTILLCLASITKLSAQIDSESYQTPQVVLKSNLLYDLTTTINLGTEFRLSENKTMDISVNYNPCNLGNNKKFKHILIQPELRFWKDEVFKNHFWGIHALYAHYNVGGIDLFTSLKDFRYQGDLYGIGASYGYQWRLSSAMSLEATFGLGYIHSAYKKYECQTCGQFIKDGNKNYFGPTKVGLSLIYTIK